MVVVSLQSTNAEQTIKSVKKINKSLNITQKESTAQTQIAAAAVKGNIKLEM